MFKSRISQFLKKSAIVLDDAPAKLLVSYREEGIVIPRFSASDLAQFKGRQRLELAYLFQLEDEGYLTPAVEDWLLTWDDLYRLAENPDHFSSVDLLDVPPSISIKPVLASQGSLSDPTFKVFVKGWKKPDGMEIVGPLQRTGAVCVIDGQQYLMPGIAWSVLRTVKEFSRNQRENPGEGTNQLGWATVRKVAKNAGAPFDSFLDRTVVVRPESLRLKLKKSTQLGLHVMEVEPLLEDQPEGWISAFDGLNHVPDRYAIPSSNGGIVHVLITPEVKTVLQEIRALPARRVAGDRALQMLRNPYACLGDDANKVLDQDQFEQDREDAGFAFLRFSLEPNFTDQGKIDSVVLKLDPLSLHDMTGTSFTFSESKKLAPFVHELEIKLAAGLPCGFWDGYELELSDFDQTQFEEVSALLKRWQQEEAGGVFDGLFDLDQYGRRVTGIGTAIRPSSPFLMGSSGQHWLPEELLNSFGLDGALLAKWDKDNPDLLAQFKANIEKAEADGAGTVVIPGLEATVPVSTAKIIAIAWSEKLAGAPAKTGSSDNKPVRSVLQIDDNIEELSYVERRAAALQLASAAHPALPEALLQDVHLRDHQLRGIAWLQHLFQCSPVHASGCLLADDMGLGKTLQLLSFIAWHLEQSPHADPVLIVAPVSLLDNWEAEMQRFFASGFASVLKLYGAELSRVKFAKNQIPGEIRQRGIHNLLKPNWRQGKQIVLTTYETLRDQEFSLARQQWSIVVCDEAQKIKNPAALVTQAAKAVPSRFKIACTGTPVENSLTDLWCLFDFIQPGLLGALNEFGRKYRQPVEVRNDQELKALDELRALVEPQILRRMKSDVAKDLPDKIEADDCRQLWMSQKQLHLYKNEVSRFKQKSELLTETTGNKGTSILGLLHTMKMICAHPHAVHPEGDLLDVSPKMRWLKQSLEKIRERGEKVIVFTELRDIQRALQLMILDCFGLHVTVVNGATNPSGGKGPSRQMLIDDFQRKQGFNVIILSTTAVGFGVNVQAANHVIHFTRCWNPAKEDQATDRAYRIGQTKDVYVYYPTVASQEFESFEQKLDKLLTRKRGLASDMLNGAGDINVLELATDDVTG